MFGLKFYITNKEGNAVWGYDKHIFVYKYKLKLKTKMFKLQVKYLYSLMKWKIHSAHAYTNMI